jgi:nucleotide-binding universal stress UspA family protein
MVFERILFPVDFSERSRAIVPHVRAACERFKASLTLLHFVHLPPLAYGSPDAPVVFDFPTDELGIAADKNLAEFAATAFPGISVKTVVDLGDPGLGISAYAREHKMDLIMMPTRGLGRFRATLLGSVAAKTIHDAPCAVWTDAHSEAMGEHVCWRSVICAIDTDAEGEKLIRAAAAVTAGHRVTVRLAHAIPIRALPQPEADPEYSSEYLRFSEFLKDEAMQRIAKMQQDAGTNFHVCLEMGGITRVAHHAAASHEADLVMIGRGVLPRFAGGLRSEVYSIVRDMPCPVLTI